jgi:3',5'-cyclic AMP phosphodiesterase CpdA
MNRLATLLHISDLHLGDIDPVTKDSEMPPHWEKFSWFDGLRGHSYHALVKLDRFWGKLQQEQPLLLVTGDITACGSEEQYSTAADFLGKELVLPKGQYVGLGKSDWNRFAIPGNHDNWPGPPPFSGLRSPVSRKRIEKRPTTKRMSYDWPAAIRFPSWESIPIVTLIRVYSTEGWLVALSSQN